MSLLKTSIILVSLLSSFYFSAVIASTAKLKVLSSANPDSNARQSFIIVPDDALIPEGIKHDSKTSLLAKQVPFIVELPKQLEAEYDIQWQVKAINPYHTKIKILSSYNGEEPGYHANKEWKSPLLNKDARNRHKLIFSPGNIKHKTGVYKKGRGNKNTRRKYGGGTTAINLKAYNPRIGYRVSAGIMSNGTFIETYKTTIQMDKKDMIRQEYINHYGIKRYGYGRNGNLPVPHRDEITPLPEQKIIHGNPLTESKYQLIINDGIQDITKIVKNLYQYQLSNHKDMPLKNIHGETLPTPNNKLWLSGGWRNPERNEWYSNAVNGIHQRGGAVDFVIKNPPGDINTAISYWILWNALQNNKNKLHAFWQLETNGRPMRTNEFIEDSEPENGIPDAFDKADHLHINVIYKKQ